MARDTILTGWASGQGGKRNAHVLRSLEGERMQRGDRKSEDGKR
jgi:hypothetical protein